MSYSIPRDQWGLLEKAVFCDQPTVFYLWLWCGKEAQGAAFEIPFTETETQASEGIMCSMDAHAADTHRMSPLWCLAVKFCDSWPVVTFPHYVLHCKLKQHRFPRHLSQSGGRKNLQPVFRLMVLTLCDASSLRKPMHIVVNSFSFVGSSSGVCVCVCVRAAFCINRNEP